MRRDETAMGGAGREFPSTLWSDVLAAGRAEDPTSREKLERLLREYWKPVFAFVRVAFRKTVEDAKDLTQAFFTHMLQKGYLSRATPERGSFRAYLKVALKHFLIDAERAAAARRPEGPLLSIDAAPGALDLIGRAEAGDDAESVYDREWMSGVLAAAVDDLRARLETEGKRDTFAIFHEYAEGRGEATYESLARKFGLQHHDVRNRLSACRKRLRELLQRRVRDYVADDADVAREVLRITGA